MDLTETEAVARARADLRIGLGIVVSDASRDWLCVALETVPPARLMSHLARGQAEVALTARRAATLKARVYHSDLARIMPPAEATPDWFAALADPARDLSVPLLGPLRSLRGGAAEAQRAALALCKGARLLPAALLVPVDGALPEHTARIDAAMVLRHTAAPVTLHRVAAAQVPLAQAGPARLTVFRPADGGEDHYAVEIGRPDRAAPVLTRLHSACLTGDLLGSLKCDCGPQLHGALSQMGSEGAGLLLYLNQEGRGIGLANKMRAYSLQDQGFDTVEANHRLGFEDDERDFRIGAAMLRAMGIGAARLMTNNPAKVAMLQACGIEVAERVPLKRGEGPLNARYLAVKSAKSGHLL